MRLVAIAAKERLTGRLAISRHDVPVVIPVNFTCGDGLVFVRLGEGRMASTIAGELVAFEVDEVDRLEHVSWSVLIRGIAREIGLDPSTSFIDDPQPRVPVPGTRLFVIEPDVVTGRRFSG